VSGRPPLRRIVGQVLVLLVVLLPALVAGSHIAAAPAVGEWERLERAWPQADPGNAGPRSLVADGFVRLVASPPDERPAPGSPAAASWLAMARLAQVAGVAGMAMLCCLVVTLAGGRARALLTGVFLAVLPPIAAEGHVLRPETPATLFALLGLLLLQCIPELQRPSSRRRWRGAALLVLGATVALAIALSVAALPGSGLVLLVPVGAAAMAAGQLAHRLLRALPRRRDWARLPLPAVSARLWPWAWCPVATLFATLFVLDVAVQDPQALVPTFSATGLLPAAWPLRVPMLALALLGALRLLLRTGRRIGRRGRLGPDFLLGLYCAVLLIAHVMRPPGDDALPQAVPMAVLLAEGSVYAVLLAAARLARRR
jgi:hypothetical protein